MLTLTFTALGLLMALNVLFYVLQPAMIYFPARTLDSTPDQWGHEYEDVYVKTSNGKTVHGWFMPRPDANITLLFFHGNAGNISHRRESIEIFLRLNLNVFIFDYEGYGNSEGSPSEQATYNDALAAWDYLVKARGAAPDKIILFGRSLGGSIAAHLATQVRPAALIVESVFSSARDMANVVMPLLSYAVLLRYRYDTVAYVKKVTTPVLVVHSEEDDIVPYRLGLKVYRAANPPKSFLSISGGHNDGFFVSGSSYTQGLRDFLETHKIR